MASRKNLTSLRLFAQMIYCDSAEYLVLRPECPGSNKLQYICENEANWGYNIKNVYFWMNSYIWGLGLIVMSRKN